MIEDFPFRVPLPSLPEGKLEVEVPLPVERFREEEPLPAVGIDGGRAEVEVEAGGAVLIALACSYPDGDKKGWGVYTPSQGESPAWKGAALMTEPLLASFKEGLVFMDGSASTFVVSLASALFAIESEPACVREEFLERLEKGAEALVSLWGRAVFCPKIIRKRHLAELVKRETGKEFPYSDLFLADLLLGEGEFVSFRSEVDRIKWPEELPLRVSVVEELNSLLRKRQVVYFKFKGCAYKVELWGDFEAGEILPKIVSFFVRGKNLLTANADKIAKRGTRCEIAINQVKVFL